MLTQNLYNTTATTINFAGAATTLNVANDATAAQTVNMFTASTGASTYNVATGVTASGSTRTINVGTNGASGSTTNVTIGSATPQNATLTQNFATVNIGASVTTASTYNVGTGATASGVTKTVNIGTNGVSGSTTNITLGSSAASSATGTITINANTVTVAQDPNAATDLAVATKRYVDQRPTIITSSTTLVARGVSRTSGVSSTGNYFVDHSAPVNLTMPASPALGDELVISDISGNAATNNITILRNGQPIQGVAEDLIVDISNATIRLVYSNSSKGWRLIA
jgi:hypothetical protein